MKTKIEEIAFLAREKGFEAKTLSTSFAMAAHLGITKKKGFLNEMCDYLLLAEMQKWLREVCKIAVMPSYSEEDVYYYFIHTDTTKNYSNRICSLPLRCKTYEEALLKGLYEALQLIK